MVVEQFVEQPTLTSVAQTVVDKVVRLHHDNYLTKRSNVTFRDDISLIIRNFNFQLRGALTPGATSPRPPPRPLPRPQPQSKDYLSSSSSSEDMTLREDTDVLSGLPDARLLPGGRAHRLDCLDGVVHSGDLHTTDTNTTSTESSYLQNPSLTQFSLDEDGRILPYVNFDLYYQAVDDAREAGLITDSQIHMYK